MPFRSQRFLTCLLPFPLLAGYALVRPTRQEAPTAARILLTPDTLVNETALGDATSLVDEQRLGADTMPQSAYSPGWTAWQYPVSVFVDLGRPYRLRRISLYDGQGTGEVIVETGKPFAWTPSFTDDMKRYQTWGDHDVDVETRYVRFTITTPGLSLPEIALYGTPAGVPAAVRPSPLPAPPQQAPMDQFIGTNAFIDDPLERMQALGFVREYHSWAWDEGDGNGAYPGYPNNAIRFNPSAAAGGNAWFFDDYYTKLNRAGVAPFPVIQGNVSWLVGKDTSGSVKPVAPGADPAKPSSYTAHAAYLYQFAARYGKTKVADSNLKLATDQPRVSSLGQVRYLENWNEQDRDWEGRAAHFSPYEYAAMTSADRDGHRGAMGKEVGMLNADPTMKLVMGGTAGLSLDYLKAIKVWSDFNRGGDFPLDVINVHHYSNTGGEQGKGSVGVSPETDHLREKLLPLVRWRNQNAPRAEVWVTEFGYDTHPASPQRAPAIGPNSQEEVQAQWIVRSYLALAAAGVDRAAQYMLRDVDPKSATQFSTSGMVTQKGEWNPKPSWFYVYTLKNRLAGMRYSGEVRSGNPKVQIYKFSKPTQTAYVIWCPTSEAATVMDYRFPLSIPKATLVTFTAGKTSGEASALSPKNGTVTLRVTERPLIVVTNVSVPAGR